MDNDFAYVRGNFTKIPLLVGEWSASPFSTEKGARWKYFDFFIRTAAKYNVSTILWDNGLDYLDRAAHKWRDQVIPQIYMNAYRGLSNSLPDTTTNDTSDEQYSSAYIYHRTGENLTDQRLPFLLNGNILENVLWKNNSLLVETDFTFKSQPDSIVFKKSLLSTIFGASSGTGVKAELTVDFNEGANIQIQAVEWDKPVLARNATKVVAGKEIFIPITWKGLDSVAAVKAIKSDGSILVDDWTQWLPPLQQGRLVSVPQCS